MTLLERRSAAWRVGISCACMLGAAYGVYLYAVYSATVYSNYHNSNNVYWILQPVFYGATAVAALVGLVQGIRSLQSPGSASGRWLSALLVMLLALTVWACMSTLATTMYAR
jgi:hypothetical protein